MEKDKKAGGAVRKTDEAKASEVSPSVDEVPSGAAVDTPPAVDTEAEKKAKKALNDKASKIKREKEAAAKKATEEEAEAKRGHFIEDGMCISCGKGNLGPGTRVKPEYFGKDGVAVLKRLVEAKAVKEVK